MSRTIQSVTVIASVLLSLVSVCVNVHVAYPADKPDWVKNNGISSRYPERKYVVGFGIAEGKNRAERKKIAKKEADADLSSRFLLQIRSELIHTKIEDEQRFDSQLKSTVSSQTNMKLIGTKTDYYDEEKKDITCALTVMEISGATHHYKFHATELRKQITDLLRIAGESEENGDLKASIKYYRETFPLFVELGETQAVLNILRGMDPFSEFESTVGSFPLSRADIERRIEKLIGEKPATISAAAFSMAEQMHGTLKEKKISLKVFPFTFQQTDFCSEFSSYFRDKLSNHLVDTNLTVLSDQSKGKDETAALTGSYWVSEKKCRIQGVITDIESGAKLAAASVSLDISIMEKENLQVKPINFLQAMKDGKVFLTKDVIPGTLSLEAWTPKGDRNLIFKEDEETSLYVRVNKPCYLQVLYHLANGMRILLYNNHYIDPSKVNHVYTLPDTFVVTRPFGVERLQIFACTERFPEVKTATKIIDGECYDNIFAEDIMKHTIATRGLKKKKPALEMAEKTVTMTMVKK